VLQAVGTASGTGGKGSTGIFTQAETGEEELVDTWAAELALLST